MTFCCRSKLSWRPSILSSCTTSLPAARFRKVATCCASLQPAVLGCNHVLLYIAEFSSMSCRRSILKPCTDVCHAARLGHRVAACCTLLQCGVLCCCHLQRDVHCCNELGSTHFDADGCGKPRARPNEMRNAPTWETPQRNEKRAYVGNAPTWETA